MSSQAERDPAEGITGIETFGLWLVGYREGLLAALPRRNVIIPDIPKDDEIVGILLEHFPETFDPHASLFLLNCPWIEVPPSIQTVLQRQYLSAEADVEKFVDINVDHNHIGFRLRSPLVVNNIDLYEERTVYGLDFNIETDTSLAGSKKKTGEWRICKYPVSSPVAENNEGNLVDHLLRNKPRHQILPATLNDLHDIVRFLENSKHRAEVREIQLFITE